MESKKELKQILEQNSSINKEIRYTRGLMRKNMSELKFFNGINKEIKIILRKALNSELITSDDALKLLKTTGNEFFALQYVANKLCIEKTQNIVTFIINRNINFTNICYQNCRFCSFRVGATDNEAFSLSVDELRKKVEEAYNNKCSEVCIQGGINPDLDFEYYLDILRTVKEIDENIHIHAYSPQEVYHMSKLSDQTIKDTLLALKKAGLDSMPGTAAEILVDKIRKIICPNKVNVEDWVNIIETAHLLGIPTTSTMMYGHIEKLNDRVEHLEILRTIQQKTKGFTEFVPLPFVKENPILSKLENHPLKTHYGMGDFKLFCVARLYFNNLIDNIQCSWVKLGPKMAQLSLNYGVNDFSGTLMEENISKSAGAEYGEYLSAEEIIRIIKDAGRIPAQRDTLYNIIQKF
ncbi:MAG: 7,8-didemethyl-8-hydroxy-5-deazariboflavin synthase subunit CofH [Candidatus Lokiarchaeota archaeon]